MEQPLVKGGQGRSGVDLATGVLVGGGVGSIIAVFAFSVWGGVLAVAVAMIWYALGWLEHDDWINVSSYRLGSADERQRIMAGLDHIGKDAN